MTDKLIEDLVKCVDQLMPGVGHTCADVGLLNETLIVARRHLRTASTQVNVPAGAERCDTCDTVTARLDGDGCAKWCCFCGARLTGNYVTTLDGKP